MTDAEIAVEEFRGLRGEITTRTQLAYGLLALELSALGVALSFFREFPEVALGLGVASTFLWLVWMDHVAQVWKIAAYIAVVLAPKLRIIDPQALGWERFLRRLDAGGSEAAEALFGSTDHQVEHSHSFGITRAMTGLYGGTPLVLAAAYGIGITGEAGWNALRAAAIAVVIALWIVAVNQYRRLGRLAGDIEKAILHGPGPLGPTGEVEERDR